MINIDNLILSASGWRKVFTSSGKENSDYPKIGTENTYLVMTAAETFADYVCSVTGNSTPTIVCGIDTRPTGPSIADAVLRILIAKNIVVRYLGITAAPEIMAYSTKYDGFIYISASHNPIGHNGIKFGLNDGGVICAAENAKLSDTFRKQCADNEIEKHLSALSKKCKPSDIDWIYMEAVATKKEAVAAYHSFIMQVISGSSKAAIQNDLFALLRSKALTQKVGVVCDMNGSARTLSLDQQFLEECGVEFFAINNKPGEIKHAIIPEPENLVWCADEMERLQRAGKKEVVLGYMPDCDGDRGNIVYWDEVEEKPKILPAQEVFSLSVLSELAFSASMNSSVQSYKPAVVVNGPTSMRVDEIVQAFGAKIFRAEVGEANVVNLAREKRQEGYTVRILGEGSNGGNITHPEAVRDPINTLFALIKLLVLQSEDDSFPGLYKLWCKKAKIHYSSKDHFTMTDILKTLPVYVTTGVSEKRAVMHVKTQDHAELKRRFQKEFEKEWEVKQVSLLKKYGIDSYEAVATNGTKETRNITDFGISGKGGLKILFYGKEGRTSPTAFIWMRGSGTEPVFRIMCDVKGPKPDMEADLLQWETQMIESADQQ